MGCGASAGGASAGAASDKATTSPMPAEPVFKALDLSPDIDGLFDTVKVIFTDLTKLNEELNTGIKEVMTDTTLLALEQKKQRSQRGIKISSSRGG